ncbi:MAG TPA: hypothetical protein VIJ07_10675 [Dermatophilaceae bacterium]
MPPRDRGDLTTAHPTKRESKRARKIGYFVGFMVNSIMLFIVNVRPGW